MLGPIALFVLYYKIMFPGLVNPDAMDFAQLARNLSSGHGFSTFVLRPLALTHGSNPLNQPDLVHGPLYPFILAMAFGVLGAKDSVAAYVSGLFYLLTIPVVYLMGRRVFSHKVGLYTALIFTFNALLLEYAASGLHITLYVFLATCLMLTTYNLVRKINEMDDAVKPRFPRGLTALAGILTALLYLTDPIFFWFMPAMAVAVIWFCPRNRGAAAIWFLIPMFTLAAPWMIRNASLTGNPLFGLSGMQLWMNTKNTYPGDIAWRMFSADLTPGKGLLNDVFRKFLLGAGQVIQAFPQVTASWVLAFFLPSLLFRFTDRAVNSLRITMMSCFCSIFFGMLLFNLQMPLFVSLIPTMLVFSVAYLLYLAQQAKLTGPGAAFLSILVTVAVVFPLVSDLTLSDHTPRLKEAETVMALGKISKPGDVVLCDQPWVVAWYANRPSVWIPADDARITSVRNQFKDAKWLCMTERVSRYSPSWQYVYQVFYQWNSAVSRAVATKGKVPGPIQIRGSQPPLAQSLNGFVSIPPLDKAQSNTFLAVVQ